MPTISNLQVCGNKSLTTLSDACVRDLWTALAPFAFLILVLLSATPPARFLLHVFRKPFINFLTLHEAEALISGDGTIDEEGENMVPLWRTLILTAISLVQSLLWVGVGCFCLITWPETIWDGVRGIMMASTWFYAALRPIVKPVVVVPYDLLALLVLHVVLGIVALVGHIFDRYVSNSPLPHISSLVIEISSLISAAVLLPVLLNVPLAIPSKQVRKEEIGKTISPEDYTTVWGWASFRWIVPLLNLGTHNTLNESDVWMLSPTMQSRPLHIKFSRTSGKLLRRLWDSNSLDIILDFTLTYVSVAFNYAGPFFLKRILDSLDLGGRNPEKRALAFVYAFLAFASSLCKAQANLQHAWFARRASTRIRMELMASIYDKALKRKDFSGVVDKDAAAASAAKDAGDSKPDARANNPKAGADIGKIVNLMTSDASRISGTVTGLYFLYGAPFELALAATFLYQLLGLSAFAGFAIMFLSWPLTNFITSRNIRIQKGLSTARDKRLGVLNELISAIKFIKFFAWEDRWIRRAMDAREVELGWMFKSRLNSVLFSLVWTCVPILVSVTAFFVYVAQGNELTIGTAFAAIAVFQMIRIPLNVIPAFVVGLLQTKISIDRIATFLEEDEVDEQVSMLKKGHVNPSEDGEVGLGIINGSFKWNEVEEKKPDGKSKDAAKAADKSVATSSPTGAGPSGETSNIAESASSRASNAGDRRFELKDVSIMFPEGKLTVVTGPTASGKTALLLALLGELTLLEGRIVLSKNASKVDENGLAQTISYAAQTPWLRHQSIKDNILFGHPYDEERYRAVVECCALSPDLEILEDGDATEIGARGVSLSGGQKARVALARAVYTPSKYVLLDDPLSAVDSHTARYLYEKLFRGPLLANRTVILVTHHVELVLPAAYYLVRLLNGRIDTQGTVKELRDLGVLDDIARVEEAEALKEHAARETEEPDAKEEAVADGDGAGAAKDKKPRRLVEEEHREVGSVKWHIYNTYLKAASYWTWGILLVLLILYQLLELSEKLWIKIWGEAYGEPSTGFVVPHARLHDEHQTIFGDYTSPGVLLAQVPFNLPPAQDHPYFYVGIYAAITLSTGVVNVAAMLAQFIGGLRASRILFARLLETVVRATMRWHDVTPQGRMLNRFSKDVETVDISLANTLEAVNHALSIFFISVLTIIVIFPGFLIPAIVLGYFYRRAAIAYLNTGRDLRRMGSNTRSPIFASFSELLEGIVTVRAFGAEQRFLDKFYAAVDLTTQMWYTLWMTNIWLQLTFDTLGALAILATTLFALSGYVDAGLAGVCITSAMAFTTNLYWACRFWTDLELDLNSVERVVEYLELPQEPPAIIESNRPPAYWPSATSANQESLLVVEDLVVKYAPALPAVLHGISFSLRARERVGILGRTGSGKSTLAMSLLRFIDPASGRIIIDGIDINTIGVYDLRSRLLTMMQDAALFSGTLRENVDPFGEHTDAECLDVLCRVQLLTDNQLAWQRISRDASCATSIHEHEDTAASSSTGPAETENKTAITLDTQVSPGGTNFSQGQRQLIALARALLRRSTIIILDEATSSIDFATDAKIQAIIRQEFGDSLLLTVAHRLRTIIDYDRLIVLDKGELVEFDTPLKLITKEGGFFRNMCLNSGTFAELVAAAKANAERYRHGAFQDRPG
ncbi:multidrug resistance-associated ABC transporter [Trametes polyzona]|nr:multidrug resistance-associated ABC transporter [Trametes polyzona]